MRKTGTSALAILFLGHLGCATTGSRASKAVDTDGAAGGDALRFHIREGRIDNYFYRRGPIAAHLVLRGGPRPRLIVAFPAGNSGVALWFEEGDHPVEASLEGPLEEVEEPSGLRGIRGVLRLKADRLAVRQAVLGSVRTIREVMHGAALDEKLAPESEVAGDRLVFSRQSVGKKARYRLALQVLDGRVEAGPPAVRAKEGAGEIRVGFTALTDEEPLTPIPIGSLLTEEAGSDRLSAQVLAFLSYEEKLLAGSWRFLTYFGRDTLLSLQLLMPVLQPPVVEAGLSSVLVRLSEKGRVAHEEDIGEYAAIENMQRSTPPEDLRQPSYVYEMLDDDLLLSLVAATYLLDTDGGRARAEAFLDRKGRSGAPLRDALARNLELVLELARPFAASPGPDTLISLSEGANDGQWRDSEEGLGMGRIPYDVNAELMPAALEAAARLYESGLLGDGSKKAEEADELASVWHGARKLFLVDLPAAEAKQRVSRYAQAVGLPPDLGTEALKQDVAFDALALSADGRPLPVMHTDEGFGLLFGRPPPEALDRVATQLFRPFPAGLRTDIGVVVANPAYVEEQKEQSLFTRSHYHGTVVWPWQHAMLLAGLKRQLKRDDLPPTVRERLASARDQLTEIVRATRDLRTSELWSWSYVPEEHRFQVAPFGQGEGHRTESNAAQLWSTVLLAFPETEQEPVP